MYHLPENIIINIYQFDPTYYNYFTSYIVPKINNLGVSLFTKGQCYNLPITIGKYAKQWKYINCIKKKHTIIITKPFGVLATCQNCFKIQSFYYLK